PVLQDTDDAWVTDWRVDGRERMPSEIDNQRYRNGDAGLTSDNWRCVSRLCSIPGSRCSRVAAEML
ncbi:MAG TPA: hypothetical protein VIX63_16250, partial [Vicinamibacterales bacterium]